MTQPITAVSAARRSLQIVELAGRFRDERRFLPLCCQCAQYGARWSCPPLNLDPDEFLGRFDAALLFAAQFFFDRSLIETARAPDAAGRVMSQTADWGKNALARELLLLEARLPGSEALFAGSCGWCGRCARPRRPKALCQSGPDAPVRRRAEPGCDRRFARAVRHRAALAQRRASRLLHAGGRAAAARRSASGRCGRAARGRAWPSSFYTIIKTSR